MTPQQTISECFHKLIINTLTEYLPRGSRVTKEHKSKPYIIRDGDVSTKLYEFLDQLKILGIQVIQPEEYTRQGEAKTTKVLPTFEEQIISNIEDLWLLSSDAHIVTVAQRLDVKAIAALDRDFLRVIQKGIDMYTSEVFL